MKPDSRLELQTAAEASRGVARIQDILQLDLLYLRPDVLHSFESTLEPELLQVFRCLPWLSTSFCGCGITSHLYTIKIHIYCLRAKDKLAPIGILFFFPLRGTRNNQRRKGTPADKAILESLEIHHRAGFRQRRKVQRWSAKWQHAN